MYFDIMLAIINRTISTTWVYRENGVLVKHYIKLDCKLPTLNVQILI